VTQIHSPDGAPAEPATGLPNLPEHPTGQQYRQYQSEYLEQSGMSPLQDYTTVLVTAAIGEAKTCQTAGNPLQLKIKNNGVYGGESRSKEFSNFRHSTPKSLLNGVEMSGVFGPLDVGANLVVAVTRLGLLAKSPSFETKNSS
jgi:hypothetical protein